MEKEQAELIAKMLYHAKEIAYDEERDDLLRATQSVMSELALGSDASEQDIARHLFYHTN